MPNGQNQKGSCLGWKDRPSTSSLGEESLELGMPFKYDSQNLLRTGNKIAEHGQTIDSDERLCILLKELRIYGKAATRKR